MENRYKDLLRLILGSGELRLNRTATPAYSMFGLQLKYNISEYFPLLTSKFIDIEIIKTEFQWFINGNTDTKIFIDKGIHIWDAWADRHGNLGPVYGYQMLNYNGTSHNQLAEVLISLATNPYGRRHIITLWNPLQLKDMALPPCYLYFQFYVRAGKYLDMFVVQRSGDMFGGIPYDIGLFAHFLIFVATMTDLKPANINLNIVDAHIYQDHIAGVQEYLSRETHPLPTWSYSNNGLEIINYKSESRIKINIAI